MSGLVSAGLSLPHFWNSLYRDPVAVGPAWRSWTYFGTRILDDLSLSLLTLSLSLVRKGQRV